MPATEPDLAGLPRVDLRAAVARVADDLRRLDGACLLVTGGTGFFGRWVLGLLAQARADLGIELTATVLSRDPAAFAARHPGLAAKGFLHLVGGDVRDFAAPNRRFTHVLHAATDTSTAADRDPDTLVSCIVDGTRRVLDIAAQAGAQRLLYVSSGAVYGRQPAGLAAIPENHAGACDPLDPRSAYGEAKRLAEHLCASRAARGGPEAVIARCFAFVGPGLPLDGHFAIGNFVRDALARRPIVVAGDGTPMRSYLYAGDLAAWLVALLVRGRSEAAYNIGSDEGLSIADLARRVAKLIPGQGVEIRGVPEPGTPRSRYLPDIGRARWELGLDVWTPLDAAILATAADARRRAEGG